MIHITIDQLLNVWMELEDALRGENSYDGHIAEIYRYTVERLNAAFEHEAIQEEQSLLEIYKLFAEKRDANITMVDHQGHRFHIKVTLSKGPKGKVTIPKKFQ